MTEGKETVFISLRGFEEHRFEEQRHVERL